MPLPAEKLPTLEALRARIAERFRGTVPDATPVPRRGPALHSGWPAVDRVLALHPGDAVTLRASPGAGGLSLTSAWARAAAREGEPVLVVDASGSSAPHPWVEPRDARAPIWVVVPPRPAEAWPAVDIALRAGAFGLVALLDPPPPPRGAGARLIHLARTKEGRLIVNGHGVVLPGSPRVSLRAVGVQWCEAPVGSAPAGRTLEVSAARSNEPQPFVEVVCDDDTHTDRLRPSPRAADRRPSHGRGRHRYEG
ncbi:MAG: hypothetical protein ACODAU_12700 [Myxococcota bacterium]